jgi:hypothetical protein
MRPVARLVLAAVVVAAAGPVLSACDSLDTLSDVWDTKKKLAGERKPVFPDGVPGISTGVPPELVRGYREPEGGGPDPARAAAEAVSGPAEKPKKPKPQQPQQTQRTASRPAPRPQPVSSDPSVTAPAQQAAPQAATAPWPAQQAAPQTATAPWPSAQPQAAWPSGSTAR